MLALLLHLASAGLVAAGTLAAFAASARWLDGPAHVATTGLALCLALHAVTALLRRLERGTKPDAPLRGMARLVAILWIWTLLAGLLGANCAAFGATYLLAEWTADEPSLAGWELAVAAAALFALGIVVAAAHRIASVRGMMKQRGTRAARSSRPPARIRKQLNWTVRDARTYRPDTAGTKKVLGSARKAARLDFVRAWLLPALTLAAAGLALTQGGERSSHESWSRQELLLAAIATGWLAYRCTSWLGLWQWPGIRQLRLGFVTIAQLPAVAISAACHLPAIFQRQNWSRTGWREANSIPTWGLWATRAATLAFLVSAFGVPEMVGVVKVAPNVADQPLPAFWPALLLAPIGLHLLITKRLRRASEHSKHFFLLFLRVFGSTGRTRFLARHIAPRWRWLGKIACIAAPDVTALQLDGEHGVDALLGQTSERFEAGGSATGGAVFKVWRRPLGSRQIDEFFCYEDTWKAVVPQLFTHNGLVLMDLRGFCEQRQGCLYELGVLIQDFPLSLAVFLVDSSTDVDFLRASLETLCAAVDEDSPNADARSITPTVLRVDRADAVASAGVLAALAHASTRIQASNRAAARRFLARVIEIVRLFAADAKDQLALLPAGRGPKALLSSIAPIDPDLGGTGSLVANKVLSLDKAGSISEFAWSVIEVERATRLHRRPAVESSPEWQALRVQARALLAELGARRTKPKASALAG